MTDRTEGDDAMTIDELARAVGMTVRNVRAHQSRGLLPPPEIRGRTGYYGPEHVARLELVKDLQAEGFNLEAIRKIAERTPAGSTSAMLDFTRALTSSFVEEEPEVVEAADLLSRWGDQVTPELVERLTKAGFLRPIADGRVEVLSPRLQGAAESLSELGVPLKTLVAVAETLRKHTEAIARSYVRLFLDDIWRPFVDGGEPAERWDEVRMALEQLRPVATDAVLGAFQVVMSEQVDRALERELARLGGEKPPKR